MIRSPVWAGALLALAPCGAAVLRAQPPVRERASVYALLGVGMSADSRNRHGGAVVAGVRHRLTGAVAASVDLQYHALDEPTAVYLTSPCPPGGQCTGTAARVPGSDLVVGLAGLEVFEVSQQKGGFLSIGLGPAVYLTQPQPGQTGRWAAALGASAGLAFPFGSMRLRLEARGLQMMRFASAPTRLLMLGVGLQVGPEAPRSGRAQAAPGEPGP